MPHKRAKLGVREQQRKQKGSDLVPSSKDSIANESIPKSALRVLNAQKIREDFKEKKRKLQAEAESGPGQGKRRKQGTEQLKILPGESIQHFNRRVEDDLRPLVKTAMDTGRAVARKVVREELEAKQLAKDKKGKGKASPSVSEPNSNSKTTTKTADATGGTTTAAASTENKHKNRPKEFQQTSTAAPKRLNDIAMAPPEIKNLPRGGSSEKVAKNPLSSTKSDVLSLAQKAMMEQEREKAIKRYREMKAARNQETEASRK